MVYLKRNQRELLKVIVFLLIACTSILSKAMKSQKIDNFIINNGNANGELSINDGNGSIGTNTIGVTSINNPTGNLSSHSGTSSLINLESPGAGNTQTTNSNTVIASPNSNQLNSNSLSQGTASTPGSVNNSNSQSGSNMNTENSTNNVSALNNNANIGPLISTGTITGIEQNDDANTNSISILNSNVNVNSNQNSNVNSNTNNNTNNNTNFSSNNNFTIPQQFLVDINFKSGKNFIIFKTSSSQFISCNCNGDTLLLTKKAFSSLFYPTKISDTIYSFRSYYGGYLSMNSNGTVDCKSRIVKDNNMLQMIVDKTTILIKKNSNYLTTELSKVYASKVKDNNKNQKFYSLN